MVTPSAESPPGSTPQYAYMFEKDKSPTKQLDALLRAIARFIVNEVGDRNESHLTPPKLAAFYKQVGGDYDSLFVEVPFSQISYIWTVTGCQHSLQPTTDDFAAPSVPALTPRGFSRWESLEILLGPEEHVPFMQYAVKNWALKHPETGESFSPDLPDSVFPSRTDKEVDYWHKTCALRMREAASRDNSANPTPQPTPEPGPDQPEPKFAYVNPRDKFKGSRSRPAEADYFGRPVSYAHVPPARHASTAGARDRASNRSPDMKSRRETPLDERDRDRDRERARRKSFSDYASPPPSSSEGPHHSHSGTYLDPGENQGPVPRRHSHPRNYSSDSNDESVDAEPADTRPKRRPSSRRGAAPPGPTPPSGSAGAPTSFRHRAEMRAEDTKRRSIPSPLGSLRNKFSETVNSILPNGLAAERPRHGSRQGTGNDPIRSRRSREQMPPSRPNRSYSDLESDESDTAGMGSDEARRRRRMREERERDRYREKARPRDVDRDREDDRDLTGRRERGYLRRPEMQRRASSHADIDRRREQMAWEMRERDRERDRERARDERRKYERRSPVVLEDDILPTGTTGVTGRRYPEPAFG